MSTTRRVARTSYARNTVAPSQPATAVAAEAPRAVRRPASPGSHRRNPCGTTLVAPEIRARRRPRCGEVPAASGPSSCRSRPSGRRGSARGDTARPAPRRHRAPGSRRTSCTTSSGSGSVGDVDGVGARRQAAGMRHDDARSSSAATPPARVMAGPRVVDEVDPVDAAAPRDVGPPGVETQYEVGDAAAHVRGTAPPARPLRPPRPGRPPARRGLRRRRRCPRPSATAPSSASIAESRSTCRLPAKNESSVRLTMAMTVGCPGRRPTAQHEPRRLRQGDVGDREPHPAMLSSVSNRSPRAASCSAVVRGRRRKRRATNLPANLRSSRRLTVQPGDRPEGMWSRPPPPPAPRRTERLSTGLARRLLGQTRPPMRAFASMPPRARNGVRVQIGSGLTGSEACQPWRFSWSRRSCRHRATASPHGARSRPARRMSRGSRQPATNLVQPKTARGASRSGASGR